MAGVLRAIRAWRAERNRPAVLQGSGGPALCRGFQTIPHSGPANLRVAVVAPVDEFFASILSERGRLFAATLGFVAAMVPIVFFIGSLLSQIAAGAGRGDRPDSEVRALFAPPVRSVIREIDELGRSVSTMRTVTRDIFAFRAAAAGGEADRDRNAASTRWNASGSHAVVLRRRRISPKSRRRRIPARVMQYTSRYFAAMSHEIMTPCRHRRQIHRRCHHGDLERAGRRSGPCRQCLRRRARLSTRQCPPQCRVRAGRMAGVPNADWPSHRRGRRRQHRSRKTG